LPPRRKDEICALEGLTDSRSHFLRLGEGMTGEIITDLAELAGPKVISRTSAMQYKGSDCSDRCIVLLRWKGIVGSSSAKYRLALRPGRAWNNDRSNISWG
jgi:hypothetical protein